MRAASRIAGGIAKGAAAPGQNGQRSYGEEMICGKWLLMTPFVAVAMFAWHWGTAGIITSFTLAIIAAGMFCAFSGIDNRVNPKTGLTLTEMNRRKLLAITEHQESVRGQATRKQATRNQMRNWEEVDRKWRGVQ